MRQCIKSTFSQYGAKSELDEVAYVVLNILCATDMAYILSAYVGICKWSLVYGKYMYLYLDAASPENTFCASAALTNCQWPIATTVTSPHFIVKWPRPRVSSTVHWQGRKLREPEWSTEKCSQQWAKNEKVYKYLVNKYKLVVANKWTDFTDSSKKLRSRGSHRCKNYWRRSLLSLQCRHNGKVRENVRYDLLRLQHKKMLFLHWLKLLRNTTSFGFVLLVVHDINDNR